ncbi:hypothetical protein T4D_297 [Trichinella pseudospiralis]|uniref:Uncharacterized protein n=1 Tax=Trichinella pseudospiralis TaxID=6337 RepID=A0A0V1DNI8_TRIPS|nr:hypothetical protein T4D_297 [Trichinella pseudospiralis]
MAQWVRALTALLKTATVYLHIIINKSLGRTGASGANWSEQRT